MTEEPGFGLKDKILFRLVSILGAALIWLLGKSWRITMVGQENVEKVWKQNHRVIYAFWHGRLLVLTYTHRRQGVGILISQHRDGEFIARIVQRLGMAPVRGSSTKGGAKGVLEMVKAGQNHDLAITPDGPKGPRYKVQPGAAYLASRAGIPLIPMTNSAKSAWILKSWDRFMIPKPFSRVIVLIGQPIWVASEANQESLQQAGMKLEEELIALTEKADQYFNSN